MANSSSGWLAGQPACGWRRRPTNPPVGGLGGRVALTLAFARQARARRGTDPGLGLCAPSKGGHPKIMLEHSSRLAATPVRVRTPRLQLGVLTLNSSNLGLKT